MDLGSDGKRSNLTSTFGNARLKAEAADRPTNPSPAIKIERMGGRFTACPADSLCDRAFAATARAMFLRKRSVAPASWSGSNASTRASQFLGTQTLADVDRHPARLEEQPMAIFGDPPGARATAPSCRAGCRAHSSCGRGSRRPNRRASWRDNGGSGSRGSGHIP